MLKFVFNDIYNNSVTLTNALAVTINMEENVPADDMTAVFSYFDCNELCDVCVFDDDKKVFTGVVDEFMRVTSQSGEYIKVVARSLAAHLLDNESVPISYTQPSLDNILSRHIKPYGIKYIGDTDYTFNGTLTVSKGDTNWLVLENFCKSTTGTAPRINGNGELEINGIHNDDCVVFSNTKDGMPYTSFSQNIKRCEEISAVHIKVTNSTGYTTDIENDNAKNRNITRERYINSVLNDTPIYTADKMIMRGRKNAYIVTLISPCRLLNILGSNAKITGELCGDIDDVYVSSIRYTLKSGKEQTVVTLKRKDG